MPEGYYHSEFWDLPDLHKGFLIYFLCLNFDTGIKTKAEPLYPSYFC